MIHRMIRVLFLSILSVFIFACNSGSNSDFTHTPSVIPGELSGVAFDSLVAGAFVDVYDIDRNLITRIETDNEGRFFTPLNIKSQRLLIKVTGGQYVEEYSGVTYGITGLNKLLAVIDYQEGTSRDVVVSGFTTIATGYFEYLMGMGADEVSAVEAANSAVSDWLGFNIINTTPLLVTSNNDNFSDEYLYGLAAATVSAKMNLAGSINFYRIAYNDIIFDGLLNGVGEEGTLTFPGSVSLIDTNSYRHSLALSTLDLVLDSRLIGFDTDRIRAFIARLNNSTHTLFENPVTLPISDSPTITNLSIEDNQNVFGTLLVSFDIESSTDLTGTFVTFDGDDYFPQQGNSVSTVVNTNDYLDGTYTIDIVVNNFFGSTHITRQVNVGNSSFSVTNMSPANGETVTGQVLFTAEVSHLSGINSLFFKVGNTSQKNLMIEGDVYSVLVDTTILNNGPNTFSVEAITGNQKAFSASLEFLVDNTAPDITWSLENGTILEEVETISASINSSRLSSVQVDVFINDDLLASYPSISELSLVFDTNTYSDGEHDLTIVATDELGNDTTVTRSILIDNTPPLVTITFPKDINQNTGLPWSFDRDFNIEFRVEDSSGFTEHFKVFINDQFYTFVGNNASTRVIAPQPFIEGLYTITLEATDASGKTASDSVIVYFDSDR